MEGKPWKTKCGDIMLEPYILFTTEKCGDIMFCKFE